MPANISVRQQAPSISLYQGRDVAAFNGADLVCIRALRFSLSCVWRCIVGVRGRQNRWSDQPEQYLKVKIFDRELTVSFLLGVHSARPRSHRSITVQNFPMTSRQEVDESSHLGRLMSA